MKSHKWAKEIKAWADGEIIEYRWIPSMHTSSNWSSVGQNEIDWNLATLEFRIKPQPKVNEFAHIPYWLCCGSLDIRHHATSCSEAKAGYPERCRFGTVEEHQKRMEKPKEPQYLYVYKEIKSSKIALYDCQLNSMFELLGKIKLEVDDEV